MKPKTAIVTGASRGIGKAIAQTFAKQGIRVALLARQAQDLEALAGEINEAGGEALALPTDITHGESVQKAVGKVWETWGSIDVLVNNAGIGVFKLVAEITESDWEDVMNTNAKGTFLLTKAVIPYLKQQASGHIITIASDVARRNFAYGGLYCASKYAQDALMQVVRQEVHAFGVKVSVIYSGLVKTYFAGQAPAETPNPNKLQAQDIANAVSYIYNLPAQVVVDELLLHPFSQKHWQNP